MKHLLLTTLILFGSTAFARECISLRQIRSTKPVSSTEIEVKTGKDTYSLRVSACPMISSFDIIGFETFSSSWVCKHDDVLVIDRWDLTIRYRCWIRDIVKK